MLTFYVCVLIAVVCALAFPEYYSEWMVSDWASDPRSYTTWFDHIDVVIPEDITWDMDAPTVLFSSVATVVPGGRR